MLTARELREMDWDKANGLLPAMIQDAKTLQVLMLGYMNLEAAEQTLNTGKVTFFSRSEQLLWMKGETSGNVLHLVDMIADCDQDTFLITTQPEGPTCHRQTTSCFGEERAPGIGFLVRLGQIVDQRFTDRPEGSYTTKLADAGAGRIAQKVGEEGVEVALAAKDEGTENLCEESADLLYHLLVLLRARDLSLGDVVECLRQRHADRA